LFSFLSSAPGLTISLLESGKKNLNELTEFLQTAISKLDERPQVRQQLPFLLDGATGMLALTAALRAAF
jgi:hypothetical protein